MNEIIKYLKLAAVTHVLEEFPSSTRVLLWRVVSIASPSTYQIALMQALPHNTVNLCVIVKKQNKKTMHILNPYVNKKC